jgi:hypothetical protein
VTSVLLTQSCSLSGSCRKRQQGYWVAGLNGEWARGRRFGTAGAGRDVRERKTNTMRRNTENKGEHRLMEWKK